MKLNSASVVLAALLALWPGTLSSFGAEPQTSSQGANSEDTYKKVWKFAEWYKNDQNPIVQSLLFSGRFQYEYASVEADEGKHHEWNIRRLRLGAKSKLFRTITLHGELEFNPQEADPFYVRITDLYLRWNRNDKFAFTCRQAGHTVHDGRVDIFEGIAHHRQEQPREQHVVSPGVLSGRRRIR